MMDEKTRNKLSKIIESGVEKAKKAETVVGKEKMTSYAFLRANGNIFDSETGNLNEKNVAVIIFDPNFFYGNQAKFKTLRNYGVIECIYSPYGDSDKETVNGLINPLNSQETGKTVTNAEFEKLKKQNEQLMARLAALEESQSESRTAKLEKLQKK